MSKEAQRGVPALGALREKHRCAGLELHLRDPLSRRNQTKYVSQVGSFIEACQPGELDSVKAMVDRTLVDLEAGDSENGWTPLHWAAENRHLPVVQYLCEQGVTKRRGVGLVARRTVATRHCTVQHSRVTSLWCSV